METYRVYEAPEGCGLIFCGDCETLADAIALAKTSPIGLEESLWNTAREAGHCNGISAPTPGEESEPLAWVGDYCVCRVEFLD